MGLCALAFPMGRCLAASTANLSPCGRGRPEGAGEGKFIRFRKICRMVSLATFPIDLSDIILKLRNNENNELNPYAP